MKRMDINKAPYKYCAKHKQRFLALLPMCPICRGEMLFKESRIKRKAIKGKP